jgi:hypothetical protein
VYTEAYMRSVYRIAVYIKLHYSTLRKKIQIGEDKEKYFPVAKNMPSPSPQSQ